MTTEAEEEGHPSLSDVPTDFLRDVLLLLDAHDTAVVAVVCSLWRDLSRERFPQLVKARWLYGSSPRWPQMKADGQWVALYGARHQVDAAALRVLSHLPFPLRREAQLQQLLEWGLDIMDALLHELHLPGQLSVGRRYWARVALEQVQAACCVRELELMVAEVGEGGVDAGHPAHLERATLLVAQTQHPSDMSLRATTSGRLDLLGVELRRRMAASGATSGRPALEQLRLLLFGKAAPALSSTNPAGEVPEEGGSSGRGEGASSIVPPDGFGLNLQGNHVDYYDPLNSVISDVLDRHVGIPISMSMVTCAVAHRAGLRVQPMNMPMEVVCRMRRSADNGSSTSTAAAVNMEAQASASQAADDEFCEGDLYMRVFDGGQIMDTAEFRAFARGLGLSLPRLEPLTAVATVQRMCTNLSSVFMRSVNMSSLKTMLHMMLVPTPDSLELLRLRARSELVLCNFAASEQCAHRLQAVMAQNPNDPSLTHRLARQEAKRLLVDVREGRDKHIASCSEIKSLRPAGVLFAPGEVILHRRFGYRGVIYDYDQSCTLSEEWMRSNQVDDLPGGRHQPWYRVLVGGTGLWADMETYVAQVNMMRPFPESDTAPFFPDAASSPCASGDTSTGTSDGSVQHAEVGTYFEGPEPHAGKLVVRYRYNAYLRQRFGADDDEGF